MLIEGTQTLVKWRTKLHTQITKHTYLIDIGPPKRNVRCCNGSIVASIVHPVIFRFVSIQGARNRFKSWPDGGVGHGLGKDSEPLGIATQMKEIGQALMKNGGMILPKCLVNNRIQIKGLASVKPALQEQGLCLSIVNIQISRVFHPRIQFAVHALGTAHHRSLQVCIRPMSLQQIGNTRRIATLGRSTQFNVIRKAVLLEDFRDT